MVYPQIIEFSNYVTCLPNLAGCIANEARLNWLALGSARPFGERRNDPRFRASHGQPQWWGQWTLQPMATSVCQVMWSFFRSKAHFHTFIFFLVAQIISTRKRVEKLIKGHVPPCYDACPLAQTSSHLLVCRLACSLLFQILEDRLKP